MATRQGFANRLGSSETTTGLRAWQNSGRDEADRIGSREGVDSGQARSGVVGGYSLD